MKICTATLESVSAYSASRNHDEPKHEKESHDAYDQRTWRSKLHVNGDGTIIIPGAGFKQALDSTAQFLGMKIPGKRNATYTKHFKAGVLVIDNLDTKIPAAKAEMAKIYCNADGVRGSGKRVFRYFPMVREWHGTLDFYIADETIVKDIFELHLSECGKFRGIGRFRPENGGFNGRFRVAKTEWREG